VSHLHLLHAPRTNSLTLCYATSVTAQPTWRWVYESILFRCFLP